MENGVLYNVVVRGGDGIPVGQVKNNRWYDVGAVTGREISAEGVFDVGDGKARIEGLTLIREEDGLLFDLIPS